MFRSILANLFNFINKITGVNRANTINDTYMHSLGMLQWPCSVLQPGAQRAKMKSKYPIRHIQLENNHFKDEIHNY